MPEPQGGLGQSWFVLDFEADWVGEPGPPVEEHPPTPDPPPSGPLTGLPGSRPRPHPGARHETWKTSVEITTSTEFYETVEVETAVEISSRTEVVTTAAPAPPLPQPRSPQPPAPPSVERVGWATAVGIETSLDVRETVEMAAGLAITTTYVVTRRDDDEFIAILIANDLL